MVEVKSVCKGDECETQVRIDGVTSDIMDETISIIWSLMRDIKSEDRAAHMAVIDVLAHCDYILMGEEEGSEEHQAFEAFKKLEDSREAVKKAMATATDKAVLN